MATANTTGLKTFRVYRKVRIFRIVELLEVPTSKNAKPKPGTFNIWYCWSEGPLCSTVKELKDDIDRFLDVDCPDHKIDTETAVKVLNGESSKF